MISDKYKALYSVYAVTNDKLDAAKSILLCFLVDIKQALSIGDITTEKFRVIIATYNFEWIRFVKYVNENEGKAVFKEDGLYLALSKMFPKEMQTYEKSI